MSYPPVTSHLTYGNGQRKGAKLQAKVYKAALDNVAMQRASSPMLPPPPPPPPPAAAPLPCSSPWENAM